MLADCAVSTIKLRIKDGSIKTGTSKWITREALKEFIGKDPIDKLIDEVLHFEEQYKKFTRLIESFLSRPIQDRPGSANPNEDVNPAA